METLPESCLTVPTLFQGPGDLSAPELQRPAFWADRHHGEMLRQALSIPRNTPFYLSAFFRSGRDPSSPYLIKTDVFPRLPVKGDFLAFHYDVEAARYPLIHELSENLRITEDVFKDLKRQYPDLQASVEKLTAWSLKPEKDRGEAEAKSIEVERRKIRNHLRSLRALLEKLEGPVQSLKRLGLQDGKDMAVSREAALDIVFQLYRANQTVDRGLPGSEVDSAFDLLRRTRERRYQASVSEGLGFGVAAFDVNVTGPNAVNRDLGDIVLEETYQALKERFQGSAVTKGTRTSFRVVNPDGKLLTQDMLLKLEADIHDRIAKRVDLSKEGAWKTFLEKYHVGLTAGYAEVQFSPDEVRVGANGEYEMESVNELLKKVDHVFRLAQAGSQEMTLRLKEEEAQRDPSKAERLHYGQVPITDLNGIPEARFFEPGEAGVVKPAPRRLVHNIQGLMGGLKPFHSHLNNIERLVDDPLGKPYLVKDVLLGNKDAMPLLEGVGQQYYSISYDVSHDLRMPRLVERAFAAERVDTVIRETGGAHLMFVELGQFYSFVRSWYGGNEDRYVHDLIYEFNKVMIKRGLVQMHPANQAALLDGQGRIAVDPKTGQYFQLNGQSFDSVSGIRILPGRGTAFPVGSEVVLAMRDGDELGFIVGDKKADGTPVSKDDLKEAFAEFEQVIKNNYSHMFIDDIEKVGPEKIRTPKWQRLVYQNGKVGKHVLADKSIRMQEADVTAEYTGWVLDYEPVKEGVPQDVPETQRAAKEASDVVVGRKARWRFFENGEVTNKVFFGKTFHFSDKSAALPEVTFPEELRETVPDLLREPILAKAQTRLSAGFVNVDLQSGAQLDQAWKDANDLSKKSKEKGGEPLFLDAKPSAGYKPAGHQYEKAISGPRSIEVANYFQAYAKPGEPAQGKPLGTELKEFLAEHGKELARLIDPLQPRTFERQILRLVKSKVPEAEQQAKLKAEIEVQLKEAGALVRVRDALAATQVLKREGLNIDYRGLGPALWTAMESGEKALGEGSATQLLHENKARFVKLYVQQTGEMPPQEVLSEARKFIDPRAVFIPEEIFALAKHYKVAPERVPFMVAGLKADDIRQKGQEAFRQLNFEDLKALADSAEGQAFLKHPKNAMLLQDTLSSRLAFQGVPLATSMATIFPAEMLCKYLAEKVGAKYGLNKRDVEELKFGMTLYFVHTVNITAGGAWEVVMNRHVAGRALVRGRAAEGMKSLTEILKARINGGILQGSRLAGQELVTVGLKTGDSLGKAVGAGILEKWGWRTAAEKVSWRLAAWQMVSGVPRVPLNLLATMGPGYLSATLFDRGTGIWLKPDHPVRKWGSFIAFFGPDMVRIALGSSRIAASPLLSRAGSLFTRAGNGLLMVALFNYGMRRFAVDGDYDAWVNRRVTDKIYDNNVYNIGSQPWYHLPFSAVRAGARWLAPDAIEWAVGEVDNKDIRKQILDEDLANSRQVTQGMKELIPKLMALPVSFPVNQAESYFRLDFSALTKPVELSPKEQELMKKMGEGTGELSEEAFAGMNAEQRESSLLRIQNYQIQQGARYLLAVGQKENEWARKFFNDDGTLQAGNGEALLDHLLPAKAGEPSAVEKILTSRKVMVAMALFDGQETFRGHNAQDLGRIAGVLDENKKYVLSPAVYAGLTLYTAQAYETKVERSMERVQGLIGKLQVAYLKADEKERAKYLEALRCLGVQP